MAINPVDKTSSTLQSPEKHSEQNVDLSAAHTVSEDDISFIPCEVSDGQASVVGPFDEIDSRKSDPIEPADGVAITL